MNKVISQQQNQTFEAIKNLDTNGNEFWYARVLAKTLDYADFRNFLKVIDKAKIACEASGNKALDHIVEINEMVQIGSGATREMPSFALFSSSHGLRGNSYGDALRSVTQSVANCIPMQRGCESIVLLASPLETGGLRGSIKI